MSRIAIIKSRRFWRFFCQPLSAIFTFALATIFIFFLPKPYMLTFLELFFSAFFRRFFVSHCQPCPFSKIEVLFFRKKSCHNKVKYVKMKFRPCWSEVVFSIFFPRLFSGNRFWTFLKMSNFDFPKKVLRIFFIF